MNDQARKEYDELSDLIDSIENDDTMQRKMDAFAQKKQRKRRLKKLEEEPGATQTVPVQQPVRPKQQTPPQPSLGETVVIPATQKPAQTDQSQTTVFHPGAVSDSNAKANNETVVINDNEIQNILEETSTQNQRPVSSQPKKPSRLPVVVAILAVFATLMLGIGIYTMVTGNVLFSGTQDTSDVTDAEYEDILGWAQNYDSLSKDGKEEIVRYEGIYNRLSDSQKAQIDALLKEQTGKTFNQLLASAKSNEKADSKNDDVKKAEKKAELREQIATLQDQLAVAQAELQATTDSMTTIQGQMNTLQTQIDATNAEITAAQKALTEAEAKLNEDPSDKEAQAAYEKAQAAYQKAVGKDVDSMQAEYSQLDIQYSQLYNQQQAQQGTVNSLNSQIQALQAELAEL